MKYKTKDLTAMALCTALLAIGAFLRIPSPVAGYFTLQLPFVIFVSVILGPRRAFFSVAAYVCGGLLGIPWFAGGGGIGYVLKPTFGFLLAFVLATFIAGQSKFTNLFYNYVATFFATIFVWVYGMIHYVTVLNLSTETHVAYTTALFGILSPDFYIDLLLTVVFTKLALRIRTLVEV